MLLPLVADDDFVVSKRLAGHDPLAEPDDHRASDLELVRNVGPSFRRIRTREDRASRACFAMSPAARCRSFRPMAASTDSGVAEYPQNRRTEASAAPPQSSLVHLSNEREIRHHHPVTLASGDRWVGRLRRSLVDRTAETQNDGKNHAGREAHGASPFTKRAVATSVAARAKCDKRRFVRGARRFGCRILPHSGSVRVGIEHAALRSPAPRGEPDELLDAETQASVRGVRVRRRKDRAFERQRRLRRSLEARGDPRAGHRSVDEEALRATVRLHRAVCRLASRARRVRSVLEASIPRDAKRVVTFLREKPARKLALPIELDGARIVAVHGREAFTAYVQSPKGAVFMVLLEKTFGKEQTTRTWGTVEKLARSES